MAAENRLTTQALAHLGPATGTWRAEADRFIADAATHAILVTGGHRRIEAGLNEQFVRIAREAVRLNQRSDGERALDTAAAGARGLVRGARNFAIGAGKLIAINIGAGMLGGLGLLVAGAYQAYHVFKGVEHRVEQLRSVWHERGVVGKWLAVEETMRVIVADQLGVTGLVEGIVHHEAITHRTLSNEDAAARYSESALMLVAGAIVAKHAGSPHEQLIAGREAPQLPMPVATTRLPEGMQVPKQLGSGASAPTTAGVTRPPATPTPGGTHGELSTGVERPQARRGDSSANDAATTTQAEAPPPIQEAPPQRSPVERALEILGRQGGSVRKAIIELNAERLTQAEMVEALGEMYRASGRDVGGTIRLADGTVVLLSRRVGPNQPVNLVRPNGAAEFGTAEIYIDLSRGAAQPLAVRDVRGAAGEPLPVEATSEAVRPSTEAPAKTVTTPRPEASPLRREQRLQELSKDPDHAGAITEASKREAIVALALEEQGRLKPPVRRPERGDGHTGDFVDGDGVDWDVKGPLSRATLIERIRASNAAKGRPPPKLDPDRPMNGEFTVETMMSAIDRELKAGERVIIDAQGLTPTDLAALKEAIAAKGLVLEQDVVIYE